MQILNGGVTEMGKIWFLFCALLLFPCVVNASVFDKVKTDTKGMTVDEVIEYCEDLTSDLLVFSTESKLKTVESLSLEKQTPTHCVGYCKTFVSLCNYAFKVHNMNAKCVQERKQVYLFDFNFTKLLSGLFRKCGFTKAANFTKDHDIVTVRQKDKSMVLDPLVYDVLGVNHLWGIEYK